MLHDLIQLLLQFLTPIIKLMRHSVLAKILEIKTAWKKEPTEHILTDLLIYEDVDNVLADFWTSHHSMCGHFSQVATGKVPEACFLIWAEQLVVVRVCICSPRWSVAFTKQQGQGVCVCLCEYLWGFCKDKRLGQKRIADSPPVFSATVVCLTKATSPAPSSRHLPGYTALTERGGGQRKAWGFIMKAVSPCASPECSGVAVVLLLGTGFAFGAIVNTTATADTVITEGGSGICSWGAAAGEIVAWGSRRRRASIGGAAVMLRCKESVQWLTKVAVAGRLVDPAHGNVPACCSTYASVAGPHASQRLPGQAWRLLHHSDSVVRRGWACHVKDMWMWGTDTGFWSSTLPINCLNWGEMQWQVDYLRGPRIWLRGEDRNKYSHF